MELVSIESSLYFWTKKEERTILFLSHRPFVPFLNRWMDIARRLLVGNMMARVRFESAEEARHFNPDSDPVLWLRDGSGSGSGSGRGGRHRCQNERRVASMGGQPRNERVSIVVSFRYRGVKSSAIESAVTRNAVNCRVSASILIRFFSLPHPFFSLEQKPSMTRPILDHRVRVGGDECRTLSILERGASSSRLVSYANRL